MSDQITTTIAAEVQRIIDAKGDIIDAIEKKSVTVSEGAKISDLASYIDQITTGTSTEPALSLLTRENLDIDQTNGTVTIPAGYKTTTLEITLADIAPGSISKAEHDQILEQLKNI